MNSIDAPQIFEYKSEGLNVTPYDVKWLPYSATAVMIGQTPKMEGCIQFYRMQNQKLDKIFSQNFGKGLKTCSWNMYQGKDNVQLAIGDVSGKLFIFDMEKEKKIYEVQAHKGMINKIDSVGGVIGKGPVEIVTGGSDGKVQLFDPRQTDPVLTLKPKENSPSIPDCWAVALGNVENHQERCIAAGYDDGDVKIFDLRKNQLIMDENLKNGICGLEFDRKDIKMNKLVATSLEGKIYAYDLRTNHPVDGFASMQKKISDATIWGVKHSPHNREIFMAQGGDGMLHLFKYNYPTQRYVLDAENRKKGVMGEIELLNDYKISDQPAVGFDWNCDKQGLAITCAIDQKLKVIVVTKLEKYDQLIWSKQNQKIQQSYLYNQQIYKE